MSFRPSELLTVIPTERSEWSESRKKDTLDYAINCSARYDEERGQTAPLGMTGVGYDKRLLRFARNDGALGMTTTCHTDQAKRGFLLSFRPSELLTVIPTERSEWSESRKKDTLDYAINCSARYDEERGQTAPLGMTGVGYDKRLLRFARNDGALGMTTTCHTDQAKRGFLLSFRPSELLTVIPTERSEWSESRKKDTLDYAINCSARYDGREVSQGDCFVAVAPRNDCLPSFRPSEASGVNLEKRYARLRNKLLRSV